MWVVRLKAIEKNLTKGCRVGLVFFSLLSVGHERRKKKASLLCFGREYASMEELGGGRGAYSMYRKSSSHPWRNKIST